LGQKLIPFYVNYKEMEVLDVLFQDDYHSFFLKNITSIDSTSYSK